MERTLSQADLEKYINDEIEESLTLDYKSSGSLVKENEPKKIEITKDVAAMANSAGGTIIYGIQEYNDKSKKHLPEKLSPINRIEISKEWLEQVINGIRPRIDGVVVIPVPLSTHENHVAYVVEIPSSTTAHQSRDHRYYKRYNFQSVPMEDHEIRDVMNRSKYPKIVLDFKINLYRRNDGRRTGSPELEIWCSNDGVVYAQYVNVEMRIPIDLVNQSIVLKDNVISNNRLGKYIPFVCRNTERDFIERKGSGLLAENVYGPKRYVPILPSMVLMLGSMCLDDDLNLTLDNVVLEWTVFADSAPPQEGIIKLSEIPIIYKKA